MRVFAASSLQDLLPQVLAPFERAVGGARATYQFAGSQTMATEIEEGARADIFISANADQAERLIAAGLAIRSATLVENGLVIAVRRESALTSVADLAAPGVRIAVGAPDVPVGQLAGRLLDALDPALAVAIRANVVTEDPNVRIALSRIELGEADAAIVYLTDLASAPNARAITLPPDVEPPQNRYVIVALNERPATAAVFEYVLGAEAQAALAEAGFTTAAASAAGAR